MSLTFQLTFKNKLDPTCPFPADGEKNSKLILLPYSLTELTLIFQFDIWRTVCHNSYSLSILEN
jgi:hypothetical protein